MKHTEFMKRLAEEMRHTLPKPYQRFQVPQARWICQLCYGGDARIHYEVSRPWTQRGQQVEIALHFETRDRQRNWHLLEVMDRHRFEIQAQVQGEVWAEMWDRGWTKLYLLLPDQEMTEDWLHEVARHWAAFITAVQPILANLEQEG